MEFREVRLHVQVIQQEKGGSAIINQAGHCLWSLHLHRTSAFVGHKRPHFSRSDLLAPLLAFVSQLIPAHLCLTSAHSLEPNSCAPAWPISCLNYLLWRLWRPTNLPQESPLEPMTSKGTSKWVSRGDSQRWPWRMVRSLTIGPCSAHGKVTNLKNSIKAKWISWTELYWV